MLLRLVRKISAEDAARLRAIKAKEKLIFNLKDAGFLLVDLEPYWDKITKVFGKEGNNSQAFGTFSQPNYGFCEDDSEIFYQRIRQQRAFRALDFCYGTNNGGVFIKLKERVGRHNLFELGPFFPKNHYQNRFNSDQVIQDIAIYFHNRRAQYKELHNYLLENKKGLSELFGEPFIEDLSLLFSVELKKKIPNFQISGAESGVSTIKKIVTSKRQVLVGLAHSYPKHSDRAGYYNFEGIENELLLNKKNQLIINFKPRYAKSIGEEEKKEFETFIDKNLNAWLKQTISAIAFGTELYEKVKTRIFVENI